MHLADREDVVLTSRLSLNGQAWLADHVVGGTVLVPATAFLELAVAAGDHTGAVHVDDLTLEAPLALPEHGAVRVQVAVGAPDERGARAFGIHARPDSGDAEQLPWTRHATGTLTPEPAAPEGRESTAPWPPADASPQPLADVYARLTELGYAYGRRSRA